MIRRDAANSKKLASLSPNALALFLMMIPHFNPHGKMNGDPMFIKSEVVPLIPWFTLPVIQAALAEIDAKTNVKLFEHGGRWYLHSLSWPEHQKLREDRLGADHLPSYLPTPGVVREESGSTPGRVPLKGKGKGKGKGKEKGKEKGCGAPHEDAADHPPLEGASAAAEQGDGGNGKDDGAGEEKRPVISLPILKLAEKAGRRPEIEAALDAFLAKTMERQDLLSLLGGASIPMAFVNAFLREAGMEAVK
jgi:hypothetical protein